MDAVLIAALFSRYPEAMDWAKKRIETNWGMVALESQPFAFDETDYYAAEMGGGLQKSFLVIDGEFDASQLAERKIEAVAWEQEYASLGKHAEKRPVNIDPGYVTLNKLVLASTKDRAHRIYLNQGIFAEVTMRYVGGWQFYPWTYPDYQRPESLEFFSKSRKYLIDLRTRRQK